VIGIFLVLFLNYYRFYKETKDSNFEILFFSGIVFRIAILTALPNLSDDFYRFVWDGRLLNNGIDPFSKTPVQFKNLGFPAEGLNESLYDKLNSKAYHTVYPPVNQLIFWFSTFVFPGSVFWSVIVMKIFVIGADVGNMFIIRKLAERFNLQKKNILLYTLNPLVIIEISGNLHFESIMIFFVLLSFLLLSEKKLYASSAALSAGVLSKLLPLAFYPALITRMRPARVVIYFLISLIIIFSGFSYFLQGNLLHGLSNSLSLYFQKFEFNAGIYYLLREIGYWIYGFNRIELIGKVLPIISAALILLISFHPRFKNRPLSEIYLLILTVYFLLSTTVHPWYITTLVALSVFTKYKFAVLWSFLVFFSYLGYKSSGFEENMIVVIIEYTSVIAYFSYEFYSLSIRLNEQRK
jgi:hypothetical protein